jgi:hypothetical protein
MLVLRNGGSAVDAVELAVKILEDREITNAGYGSNLAMDGVVECDASIVDHHGRSGAVGAVARKFSSCLSYTSPMSNRNQKSHLSCASGTQSHVADVDSSSCAAELISFTRSY